MKMLEATIPPLLLLGVSAALMWLVAWAVPAFVLDFPARSFIAVVLALGGASISASGVISFTRAGTTMNPMDLDHHCS
jgi:hypothetical protein